MTLSSAALLGSTAASHAALPPDTAEYYVDVGALPVIGNNASASGQNALAVGPRASASAVSSIALGDQAHADSERALAIGHLSSASGPLGIALGATANAAANAALAIGAYSVGGADLSAAVGYAAHALGRAATAFGAAAWATAEGSTAFGTVTLASDSGAIALGYTASATAASSIAVGRGASASEANSVALGAGARTTALTGVAFRPPGMDLPSIRGVEAVGQVSFGSAGNERRLTHVAAGADDTDAVNVSQLKAVLTSLDSQTAANAAVNYDIDASGAIQRGSVTLGGGMATPDNRTLIHNVANGVDSGDAVNLGQLNAAISGLVNNAIAGDGTVNAFFSAVGNPTSESATASGMHSVAVGANAQAAGVGTVALGVASSASGSNAIALGSGTNAGGSNAIALGANANAGGGSAIAVGANASAVGDNAIALGAGASASAKQASALGFAANAAADNSIALGQGSVADRANTLSVGAPGLQRQVTNVAAGTQGTDAVNVDQLQQSMSGVLGESRQYTDDQIRSARRDAYGGTAAAFALAALPQAVLPGRGMMAVAGGTYGGQSALAIGMSQLSATGKWAYRMQGTTDSRGQFGAAVGAGMHW